MIGLIELKRLKDMHDLIKPLVPNSEEWYIAGGAIASLYHGEEPRDWDFFCENPLPWKTAKAMQSLQNSRMKTVTSTKHAMTWEYTTVGGAIRTLQMITSNWGQPATVLGRFDFLHCMAYYSPRHHTVLFGSQACKNMLQVRQLALTTSRPLDDAASAFLRARKFCERGYTIDDATIDIILDELEKQPTSAVLSALMGHTYGFATPTPKGFKRPNPRTSLADLDDVLDDSKLDEPPTTVDEPDRDENGMVTGWDGRKVWI